jgi:hypothetical protein
MESVKAMWVDYAAYWNNTSFFNPIKGIELLEESFFVAYINVS